MSDAPVTTNGEPPRKKVMRSHVGKTFYVVTTATVIVIMVFLFFDAFFALSRPPFVMIVTAHGNSTTVTFLQPLGYDGHSLRSPDLKVDVVVPESMEFDLRQAEKKLAGAKIEFSDTTFLPGRIRVRFGGRTFDVMSSRIIVDGQDESWLPDDDK